MWGFIIAISLLFSPEETVADSSLRVSLLSMAREGHEQYSATAEIDSDKVVIIDYSRPSSQKRLYVVDLSNDQVLLETYVAHGKNSGGLNVESVSNKVNSNQSSLGFFKISERYVGKHGESYRLDGLEFGFNHNARKRAVVIHSAWYVNEEIIKSQGRLGRSFGCPALSKEVYAEFQDLIHPNSLLFVYYPDEKYFAHSAVLGGISVP